MRVSRMITRFVCVILFSLVFTNVWAKEDESVFFYKAVFGDNLWSITERHLVDIKLWQGLVKLNQLDVKKQVLPGQIIRIPKEWLKQRKSSVEIVFAKGSVKITQPDGKEISISQSVLDEDSSLILIDGSRIQTENDGLVTLKFKDGSQVLLQSNSRVLLERIDAFGDGSLVDIRLRLEVGRVESSIPSSTISNTNYEVITASGTSSVRGTNFRVSTDDAMIVEVVDGKVKADSAFVDGNVLLGAGTAVIVSEKNTSLKPIKLLAAPNVSKLPALIEETPIRVTLGGSPEVVGYSTMIVPFGGNMKEPIVSIISNDKEVIDVESVDDGRYHMLISAMDKNGIIGLPATYDFILKARPYYPMNQNPLDGGKILAKDLVFSWSNKDTLTESYYLQVSTDNTFREPFINEFGLEKNEFIYKELLKAGNYYWRVAAIDKNKIRGPFSETKLFRVLLDKPTLNENIVKTSDITLVWQGLEEGTKYHIQVAKENDFNQILFEDTVVKPSFDIKGIVPDTYYFRVQTIATDDYVDEWGAANIFVVPSK